MPRITHNVPTCPKCRHALTDAEIQALPCDVYTLAEHATRESVTCPSCATVYFVRGGYAPEFTSALEEDEL